MNEGECVADAAVPENNAMGPQSRRCRDCPESPASSAIPSPSPIRFPSGLSFQGNWQQRPACIPVNGQSSNAPYRITTWLGTGKWDVIHVNFGIWDAKIKGGKPTSDLATYEKNLHTIVGLLKASGAKVIWATTTPINPTWSSRIRESSPRSLPTTRSPSRS